MLLIKAVTCCSEPLRLHLCGTTRGFLGLNRFTRWLKELHQQVLVIYSDNCTNYQHFGQCPLSCSSLFSGVFDIRNAVFHSVPGVSFKGDLWVILSEISGCNAFSNNCLVHNICFFSFCISKEASERAALFCWCHADKGRINLRNGVCLPLDGCLHCLLGVFQLQERFLLYLCVTTGHHCFFMFFFWLCYSAFITWQKNS